MPKTKVRKSRMRKSRVRKSLRTKRGGVGEKPNKPNLQAKKSTAVFGRNMPQYPQRWSGYPVQPDSTESESEVDNASDSVPIIRKKNTSVFGKNMPQYPQRWSGYPVQPDSTESEVDNASNSVPITHKKNTSVLEPDTKSEN